MGRLVRKQTVFVLLLSLGFPRIAPARGAYCNLLVRALGFMSHEPKRAMRPWDFGPELEAEIQKIFEDPTKSDAEKLRALHERFWQARLATTNPVTRFFMRRPVKDSLRQRSIYSWTLGWLYRAVMGPHYNPIFNRTSIGVSKVPTIIELIVASHELGHAFHRNTFGWEFLVIMATAPKELFFGMLPRTAFPTMMFRAEGHSIGAQYELVRRIPPEVRQSLLAKLRQERETPVPDKARLALERLETTGTIYFFHELYHRFTEKKELTERDEETIARIIATGALNKKERDGLLEWVDRFVKARTKDGRTLTPEETLQVGLARRMIEKGAAGMTLPEAVLRIPKPDAAPSRLHQQALVVLGVSKLGFFKGIRWALKDMFRKIGIASLENAHLSKEEFVKKLRPVHGYDFEGLVEHNNSLRGIRLVLLAQALYTLPGLLSGDDDDPDGLWAWDLSLIARWLFGPAARR